MPFRFSEIFHIGYELAIRRPAILVPAAGTALLSLLLVGFGQVVLPSPGTGFEESRGAILSIYAALTASQSAAVMACATLILVTLYLCTVMLRYQLMSSVIASSLRPSWVKGMSTSLAVACCVLVLAVVFFAIIVLPFVKYTGISMSFAQSLPGVLIFFIVLIIFTALLVASVFVRFSLLYAVSFSLTVPSALSLGLALLRRHLPLSLIAFGLVALSVTAFTGLSNLAILYTSRFAAAWDMNAVSHSVVLVIPVLALTLVTVLSEALWTAFFYLIARVPASREFISLVEPDIEQIRNPGPLPPQS